MFSFDSFKNIDEVRHFGNFLVERGAIPQRGSLHMQSMILLEEMDSPVTEILLRIHGHGNDLADQFPEEYTTFKTLRRLTHG